MPPRKKAAPSTDAAKPGSSRSTRASTRQANSAPPSTASKPAKPVSKPKSTKAKRVRDDDDEADVAPSKVAKLNNDDDTSDNKAADEEKKMVTVVKRGAAPVDPMSGLVNSHQVYSNAENVWDAMLNQTEVGSNKNKFYVIQLLHPIGNNAHCSLYTRWGRVGESGSSQIKGPWPSANAISEFQKQFRSKSGVAWPQRFGMVAAKGKYTWLEREFEDGDSKVESSGSNSKEEEPVPDSKLLPELQEFCNLIFSTQFIDAHLSSMNYDAQKLPLGKLAKSTILKGFAALKKLADAIEYQDSDTTRALGGIQTACETLTSEYYSIIPHVFGRTRPTVINNQELLKKELNLVAALGDMEIAHKLINTITKVDDDGNPSNPLDAHFHSLGLQYMDPVARNSSEFEALARYISDTQGHTHYFTPSILHAFRVEREAETSAFLAKGYDKLPAGDRMLLWHGSRTTNFAGILQQGLRIAPPEAPVTGYMFGKGVYFADMMSKSAGYCYAHLSNQIGVLLLCEVAVKPFLERTGGSYNADIECKKSNKLATKGVGVTQHPNWQDAGLALGHKELEGVYMPKGEASRVDPPGGAFLMYNEYIVYDPSQIRLRYLLMVKMS